MTKIITTNIDILGKQYPVRCLESELPSLLKAADFLNMQMHEIAESGKIANLERIAIISALNITHQFLQAEHQQTNMLDKITQRISQLHHKVESSITSMLPTDLAYSAE